MDKDIAHNLYFMNSQRFADLINGYACHGKQVILPQNLQDMDPRSGMYRIKNITAEDAFDVIVQYANVPELLEKRKVFIEKDGKVNMSNAIADMIAEGREMGEEMGEDRVSELYLKLMEADRYKDMKKAAKNRKYRKKLLEEYNL